MEYFDILTKFENNRVEAMNRACRAPFMSVKWFEARKEADVWDEARRILETLGEEQSKLQ